MISDPKSRADTPPIQEPENTAADNSISTPQPTKIADDLIVSENVNISTSLHPGTAMKSSVNVQNGKQNSSKIRSRLWNPDFHVFTWLNNEHVSTSFPGGETISIVDADLAEMDRFLVNETGLEDRLAYNECPETNRSAIYDFLSQEEKEIMISEESDPRKRKIYEAEVEIVNNAENLLLFFLPPGYGGPTAAKYWGALHRLLTVSAFQFVAGIFRLPRMHFQNIIICGDVGEFSLLTKE